MLGHLPSIKEDCVLGALLTSPIVFKRDYCNFDEVEESTKRPQKTTGAISFFIRHFCELRPDVSHSHYFTIWLANMLGKRTVRTNWLIEQSYLGQYLAVPRRFIVSGGSLLPMCTSERAQYIRIPL